MIDPVYTQLLLADDDKDDCDLFKDALSELSITANLTVVNDGEQLMQFLNGEKPQFAGMIFLDLNMPRKNGFECLSEIRSNPKLQHLPVIIFSTSFDRDIVNLLYNNGAHFYISKPNEFEKLKTVIMHALSASSENRYRQPTRENFVLYP
jgi:CheY-like chemotaxis protein